MIRCVIQAFFFSGFVSLALSQVAFATGGGNGGSLRPVKGRHSSVRLMRENIRLYFDEGEFSALIDYQFKNEGPTQVVEMVVPENDYIVPSSKPGLARFSAHVDGWRIRARRQVINRQRVFPAPNALWMMKVPFKKGQSRHVRLRYRSHVWGSCALGTYYMFADNKWKGSVRERSLTLVDCSSKGDAGFDAGVPLRCRGRRYHYRWSNTDNLGTLDVTIM